jgi:hypothetical protein
MRPYPIALGVDSRRPTGGLRRSALTDTSNLDHTLIRNRNQSFRVIPRHHAARREHAERGQHANSLSNLKAREFHA